MTQVAAMYRRSNIQLQLKRATRERITVRSTTDQIPNTKNNVILSFQFQNKKLYKYYLYRMNQGIYSVVVLETHFD